MHIGYRCLVKQVKEVQITSDRKAIIGAESIAMSDIEIRLAVGRTSSQVTALQKYCRRDGGYEKDSVV